MEVEEVVAAQEAMVEAAEWQQHQGHYRPRRHCKRRALRRWLLRPPLSSVQGKPSR